MNKDQAAEGVGLNGLLACRIRKAGEIMDSGDIVLLNDTFHRLGFCTSFDHYFAGQEVTARMEGKIICKAS